MKTYRNKQVLCVLLCWLGLCVFIFFSIKFNVYTIPFYFHGIFFTRILRAFFIWLRNFSSSSFLLLLKHFEHMEDFWHRTTITFFMQIDLMIGYSACLILNNILQKSENIQISFVICCIWFK